MKPDNKEVRKYHRVVFIDLLAHTTPRTAYQIAKGDRNESNDSKYKKALEAFVQLKDVKRIEEDGKTKYLLNADKWGLLRNEQVVNFLRGNAYVIDWMVSKRKMTYREWLQKNLKLLTDVINIVILGGVKEEYKEEEVKEVFVTGLPKFLKKK